MVKKISNKTSNKNKTKPSKKYKSKTKKTKPPKKTRNKQAKQSTKPKKKQNKQIENKKKTKKSTSIANKKSKSTKKHTIGNISKNPKIIITPGLRRSWIRVRNAWINNPDSLRGVISSLSEKDKKMLFDLSKISVLTLSYIDILKAHPELNGLIFGETDRICMQEIYLFLSNYYG